ncbi:MAG: hypothetical protein ACKV22_34455 [Bryobacteraceae bacterium]
MAMEADPYSGDTIRPEGADKRWRRRVGSYRIFFSIDALAKIAAVSALVRRTSATY